MGDYIPAGVPGSETYLYQNGANGRTGWGASIKPLGGAPPAGKLFPLSGVGP